MQHVVADRAISAVRTIWADQGAAVEEVRRDYGEDLLVQTQLRGRLDDSRIWVQVKGTTQRLRNENACPSPVRVASSLALRWIRSLDLVVVVQWNLREEKGWYAVPRNIVSQAHLLEHLNETTAINFSKSDNFDVSAANRLAWLARIDSTNIQLQSALLSAQDSRGLYDDDAHLHQEEAGIILHKLLRDLGILKGDDTLGKIFRESLKESMAEHLESANIEESFAVAVVHTVLAVIDRAVPGIDLPVTLLKKISNVIHGALFDGFVKKQAASITSTDLNQRSMQQEQHL